MKLSSIIQTIRQVMQMADATPPPNKKRRSNYPFLDPANQVFTFSRTSKGTPDHNSRTQFLGKRSAAMRRVKIVH